MPQHTPAPVTARVCGHCDGFPTVAITTGIRHRDGSRAIIHITCPACQGTGHTAPAPVLLVRAGR